MPIDGGLEQPLPTDWGWSGSFSPDGKSLVFNRHPSTWSRRHYRGSYAADLWITNLADKSYTKLLADEKYNRYWPMWGADDAIYFGFDEALPHNIIRLELKARVEGVGVDPKHPPWAWEAWTGQEWAPARIYRDGTGGLNADGDIVLIMPGDHEALTVGPTRAFWLRCRMTAPNAEQPGRSGTSAM